MVFLREIKIKSGVYLARVKSYREGGKTKHVLNRNYCRQQKGFYKTLY